MPFRVVYSSEAAPGLNLAKLDGSSTIESVLLSLEKDPDRFQRMVANLLEAIALPASG